MVKNKLFKRLILVVMAVGIAAGGALCFVSFDFKKEMQKQPLTWEAFSPADGRFNAKFPGDPVKNERELNIANTKIEFNEYSTEVENSLYAVSYVDFPGSWKLLGTNKLLTKSFEKLMEQEQHLEEIMMQQLSTHEGNPSLEYHFKQAGKEVKGKLIVAGNTLYRVTITYPFAAVETLKSTDFLESFHIHG